MSQQNKQSRYRARKENVTFLRVLIALGSLVAVALVGFLVWSLAATGTTTSDPGATLEATGEPKLKADREVIDLGDIKLGNTTQASFALTNISDQPLKITEAPYIEVLEGC